MRPDQEAYRHAMDIAELDHPDTASMVRAVIDAYLEKMPKAWAVQIGDDPIHGNDVRATKLEAFDQADKFGRTRVLPIALVPLPKEKK